MPVTPYIALTAQPPTTQLNLRQMMGEVQLWNPDAPVWLVRRWIANNYRALVDHKNWSGMLVRGQVTVPTAYAVGNVSVTTGSNVVTGNGTAWDITMVGRQFRVGFTTPISTITQVNPVAQTLLLDTPWGGVSLTGAGYQIFQNLVSFGPRIKNLFTVVNQAQGFRLQLHVPQEVLNINDTWRTSTGWTFAVSDREASPLGEQQYELYPIPTFQQAFPFLASIQPPDLVNDGDYPAPYIRADIIVTMSIADALIYHGKQSKWYDPGQSQALRAKAQYELEKCARQDNDWIQKDLRWEFERYPAFQMGAAFWQSHSNDMEF